MLTHAETTTLGFQKEMSLFIYPLHIKNIAPVINSYSHPRVLLKRQHFSLTLTHKDTRNITHTRAGTQHLTDPLFSVFSTVQTYGSGKG